MRDKVTLEKAVFESYGPQLGEMLWYEFSGDPRIESVSRSRLPEFNRIIKTHGCRRVLELAPFAHFTGHILAEQHEVVLCDISARSLELGAEFAQKQGVPARAKMVSADFHDLPFPDGAFDFVFIASAVHHTRRPSKVLSEIDRVLCRDGIAYIFNEPVQRHFSFYKYRADRNAELSPADRILKDRGVLRLVTSYLANSRPEELFGMVENDKIPLAVYLDFLRGYQCLNMKLDWEAGMSDFDRKVLEHAQTGPEAAYGIGEMIREHLAGLEPTVNEVLRGFELPDGDEIDRLASRVVKEFARVESANRDEVMAEMFGAAVRIVAKKKDGPALAETLHAPAEFNPVRGVYRKDVFEIEGGLSLDVNSGAGPIIQTAEASALSETFPANEWQRVVSERGIVSMQPRVARPTIRVQPGRLAAVLIRLFANTPGATPYWLRVETDNGEVMRLTVPAPESRLVRFVAEDVSWIRFSALTLEEAPREGPPPVGISAIQMFELLDSSTTAAMGQKVEAEHPLRR